MPATPITVQLPDGSVKHCYSPSSVVLEYFAAGDELPVTEFLQTARRALMAASERVEAKFGFACSAASESLAEIEVWAAGLKPDDRLTIISI